LQSCDVAPDADNASGSGWLSAESDDAAAAGAKRDLFIIDTIDGKRAALSKGPTACPIHCISRNGKIRQRWCFCACWTGSNAVWLAGWGDAERPPIGRLRHSTLSEATRAGNQTGLIGMPAFGGQGRPPAFKRGAPSSLAIAWGWWVRAGLMAWSRCAPSWEWDFAAGALHCHRKQAQCTDRTGQRCVSTTPTRSETAVRRGGRCRPCGAG